MAAEWLSASKNKAFFAMAITSALATTENEGTALSYRRRV
jgi:hypothetical protein